MWFGFSRNHSDGMRYDFTDFGCTVSIGGEKQNSCDMRYFVLIFAERKKKLLTLCITVFELRWIIFCIYHNVGYGTNKKRV